MNVSINIDLDEFDDSDLMEHLEEKGYTILEDNEEVLNKNPRRTDLKDELCNICEVSYHTSKTDLLKLISEKI